MVQTKFNCIVCNYSTFIKTNFERHNKSSKHLKMEEAPVSDEILMRLDKLEKRLEEQTTQICKLSHKLFQLIQKRDGRLKKEPKCISGKDFLMPPEPQNVIVDDYSVATCSICEGEWFAGEEEFDEKGLLSDWVCKECSENS
jgi:hypothetical protein